MTAQIWLPRAESATLLSAGTGHGAPGHSLSHPQAVHGALPLAQPGQTPPGPGQPGHTGVTCTIPRAGRHSVFRTISAYKGRGGASVHGSLIPVWVPTDLPSSWATLSLGFYYYMSSTSCPHPPHSILLSAEHWNGFCDEMTLKGWISTGATCPEKTAPAEEKQNKSHLK